MDSAHFEHLIELDKSGLTEDMIREAQTLLGETTDPNERASLLGAMHLGYAKLGRLKEARLALDQIKQLEVTDSEIRLNVEFWQPTLLIQEGRYEDGLSAFAALLDRNSAVFQAPERRYLYEAIQRRRALTLFGLSRYKEALPILRESVSFSFDQVTDEQEVRFALGVCLEDANDVEAARQELARVVRFGLKNDIEEQALYRLAILHYKSGALAQAKQQLETILQDFPSLNPAVPRKQVYKGLSQTYRYLGDKEKEKLYKELAEKT